MSYQSYKFKVDAARCVGCGLCADLCEGQVFAIDPKTSKAYFSESADCIVCGQCEGIADDCPAGAITHA